MTLTPKTVATAATTERFSALTRVGLDVASMATWDVNLPRSPRLLVPIDVRALLVPAADTIEAVPTATVVPVTNEGAADEDVLPVPPAPFGAPAMRDAGVHLHWAMPDGLTRGDAGAARSTSVEAGNPTGLPPLPDRWVVVRLNHGTSTKRAWIIEADRGDHHDLDGWTDPGLPAADAVTGESGRRIIPPSSLTALAGGEAAWAATYDAVVDRFAFHDDLADISAAQRSGVVLSYVVAGWWSQADLDVLHDCATAGAYQERASWLGWLAPEPEGLTDWSQRSASQQQSADYLRSGTTPAMPATAKAVATSKSEVSLAWEKLVDDDAAVIAAAGPAMPRQALLHGRVVGVTLSGGPDLAPAAEALEIAVGPTAYASLSALLADGSGDERVSSERVLAAFSSGLLSTIDAPNGMAAVDDDRHASAFVGFSGGSRSQPDRIAEGNIMTTTTTATPATATTTPFAGGAKGSPAAKASGTAKATLASKSKFDIAYAATKQRAINDTNPLSAPRSYRDVAVPAPRSFLPADLAFVIRGAARSLRHGGDGRFTAEGLLACRLADQIVSGYAGMLAGDELPAALRSLSSGAIPPEIDLLLREAVLTDPYRWEELVAWTKDARDLPTREVTTRIKAELALRSVVVPTDGRTAVLDIHVADQLRAASLAHGDDASPVASTRWAQPWIPLWCDWEIELAVDDSVDRWSLGVNDFEPDDALGPNGSGTRSLTGRSLLASAAARALAAQIRQWLADEDARDAAGTGQLEEGRETELSDAAIAADGLDVLAGTFQGIRETLLGLDPLDASRVRIDADGTPTSKPRARDLPLLLAGGGATLRRLRVIDAFGRWVDVPDDRLSAAEIATAIAHPSGAPSVTLLPRFQRPSRLAFRFIDPRTADGSADVEARVDQQYPDRAVSPIAGWLMPDHVDEALEVFDASGAPLGQLMHDELTGLVVWEGAPGRSGRIGGPPDPGSDPGARHVTQFAAGLVAADVAARNDASVDAGESALSALLRAIDTTLWTVDPLGSVGTGAVAGLVGRPIAVVRALVRLDVLDDIDLLAFDDDAARAARVQAYADLAARAIAIRLGTLTRTDDSLLAYAVDDDYSQLRLVAPEVRDEARLSGRQQGQLASYGRGSEGTPMVQAIVHPYVAGDPDVLLRSGQTVRLTLFMNPGGKVHATAGLLPRKSLALARDWFHDSLARLSPSFRVGPVLVDPTTIRLPMITGLGDRQTFTRRETPLTWRDDAITAATQTAYLPEQASVLEEGWIRVVPGDEDAAS